MSDFQLYFQLGIEHIADINAYDHLLFIVSLCLLYTLKSWKNVLILVTAFTIGHSITLALSSLNFISANSDLIEFLIPITIIITCIYNILSVRISRAQQKIGIHYITALLFGLIHGMGFANYLRSLLLSNNETTVPLLAFNLGIEVGQITIVLIYFILFAIIMKLVIINHKVWVSLISLIILVISISLLF